MESESKASVEVKPQSKIYIYISCMTLHNDFYTYIYNENHSMSTQIVTGKQGFRR